MSKTKKEPTSLTKALGILLLILAALGPPRNIHLMDNGIDRPTHTHQLPHSPRPTHLPMHTPPVLHQDELTENTINNNPTDPSINPLHRRLNTAQNTNPPKTHPKQPQTNAFHKNRNRDTHTPKTPPKNPKKQPRHRLEPGESYSIR